MLFLQKFYLPDGLPFDAYAETDATHFIMEPWNTITSLFFLIPVFYWLIKLKGQYKKYPIVIWSLPFLAMNGVGSALFHAFHISRFFLALDVLPVFLLIVVLTAYFWNEILKNWYISISLIVTIIGSNVLLHLFLEPSLSINLGYLIRGTGLFLPFVFILYKIKFRYSLQAVLGILFFILALFFRTYDKTYTQYLYMGSHFLWHICTTIGVYFISDFIYNYVKIQNQEKEEALSKAKV
ncbi:MAG: hypothetical protein EAZ85_01910 [Bacteroidetes bacterium]|nr:MAG: hypothetical protein EAZ85_01910 [Bacteroidota bacterium]TAG90395.1 MAG: hypothetical protein EAZ20_04510 [Bacteroidota bacterium]